MEYHMTAGRQRWQSLRLLTRSVVTRFSLNAPINLLVFTRPTCFETVLLQLVKQSLRETPSTTSSMDEDTLMLPRSELDSLSDAQVQQVQTDLSTELFGFAPTSFTARVVDVANEVIYDVIDKIEVECMRRWVGDEQAAPVDDARKQTVQKVRLDQPNGVRTRTGTQICTYRGSIVWKRYSWQP